MRLGFVERVLVDNPVRRWFQRIVEVPYLLLAGKGLSADACVLEIGASSGYGAKCLADALSLNAVLALEYDAQMLSHRISDPRVFYVQGSGDQLPLDSAVLDAIFAFGVLHHILDWQSALKECHRVLKKGGEVYLEEFYAPLITNKFVNLIIRHPQENRFTHQQLLNEAKRLGLKCRYAKSKYGLMGWVVLEKV